jgi:CheY-like chemotaxis protein
MQLNQIPEIEMLKKVLLVDNSLVNLEIQKQFLRETQVKVFTSGNGAKAVEFARRLRPDLVYIDLAAPVMEGASCCIAIKEDPDLEGTQVVLLASPGELEITASRIAGCDAFLARPLNRRQFIKVGKALLAQSNGFEQRVPCRATVACRMEGTIFYGAIEDLDISGMFVRSHFAVKTGQRLELKFFVPEVGSGMIVTWAKAPASSRIRGGVRGIGRSFLRTDRRVCRTERTVAETVRRLVTQKGRVPTIVPCHTLSLPITV